MSLSYLELEKEIEDVPLTWIPALLSWVIKRAVLLKVFVEPNGLANFVAQQKQKCLEENPTA